MKNRKDGARFEKRWPKKVIVWDRKEQKRLKYISVDVYLKVIIS